MILSNISRMFPGKSETSDKTIPGSYFLPSNSYDMTNNLDLVRFCLFQVNLLLIFFYSLEKTLECLYRVKSSSLSLNNCNKLSLKLKINIRNYSRPVV